MLDSFIAEIHNIQYQIRGGRYLTYTELYRDLYDLERQLDFAYVHKALTYEEFNQLENEITETLLLFRSWKMNEAEKA